MSTLGANCKTKKELKSKVGKRHYFEQTSMFGDTDTENAYFTVVGPCPHTNRKWFAEVQTKDGKIEWVK